MESHERDGVKKYEIYIKLKSYKFEFVRKSVGHLI